MTYLLDSNVCIRLINNTNSAVTSRLASQKPQDILISTITQLELYYGAYRSIQKEQNLEILERFFSTFTIITLDSEAAKITGKIKAELAAVGTPIGMANNLILVTHNVKEFSRVNSLRFEDWEV